MAQEDKADKMLLRLFSLSVLTILIFTIESHASENNSKFEGNYLSIISTFSVDSIRVLSDEAILSIAKQIEPPHDIKSCKRYMDMAKNGEHFNLGNLPFKLFDFTGDGKDDLVLVTSCGNDNDNTMCPCPDLMDTPKGLLK